VPPESSESSRDRGSERACVPWPSQAHAPWVGRQVELEELKGVFEAAANGEGALIVLVGVPGIGNMTLCEQLSVFAAAAGG
jgi:hypothetical protein